MGYQMLTRSCPVSVRRPHMLSLVMSALTLAVTVSAGCASYQLGACSIYRPDVRTVHVPVFQSDSYRRFLGEWLTEAVVKEIELTTPYKVVRAQGADSVLTGRLTRDVKFMVTENRNDEPRDIEMELQVEVSWRDRRGELLVAPRRLDLPPALRQFNQAVHLVPEAGQSIATAQQGAIQRLAVQIVAAMELPW